MIRYLTASHRVCRVFGIEVRVMYSLYAFTALLLAAKVSGGNLAGGKVALVALSLAAWPFFVFLHELGHCLAAMKDGVEVKWIMLHPLGGVAQLSGLVRGPLSEINIALAGPFVNLAIAGLCFVPLFLMGNLGLWDNLSRIENFGVSFLTSLFVMNLLLAVFNFLPVFPMDGGRVATALCVMTSGPERGIALAARVAQIGIIAMIAVGALILLRDPRLGSDSFRVGFGLILIASFLHTTGRQELQARTYASLYATGRDEAARQPWEMPEWNPETGFTQGGENLGWFEKRRRQREAMELELARAEAAKLRAEADRLLAKVKEAGRDSLSPEECRTLERYSELLREKNSRTAKPA